MMTEHSQETKIAILEAKVEHMMGHVKELTQRVRANEKVVASVTLLGTVVLAVIGAGYFAPKAEACSPPADGSEFTCPPHDGLLEDIFVKSSFEDNISKETETPDYYTQEVTVWDTREEDKWNYGTVIQRMRDWKAQQNRTTVEDSINNALANLEINYGSNDPTESEELLQFQSSNDRQGT